MDRTPARYDEVADFYQDFAPDDYSDPPLSTLLDLLGDVSGLRLLDMACGHGRVTRELARRGAHVTGLDISAALLEKARELEQLDPLGITYVHADAASPDALRGKVFDGVVCHFSLSDIDDLDGALATVARILRSGGSFTFSILHPCFPGWEARTANPSWQPGQGYFREGWWRGSGLPTSLRAKVGANHRMLSTYVNALARNGLVIEETAEPHPGLDWALSAPNTDLVPVYLVMRCRKP